MIKTLNTVANDIRQTAIGNNCRSGDGPTHGSPLVGDIFVFGMLRTSVVVICSAHLLGSEAVIFVALFVSDVLNGNKRIY